MGDSMLCPVPREQQPCYEYEQLKDSWFFRWPALEQVSYSQKILWVWFWAWAIASPIAAASFPLQKKPFLFLLSSVVGSGFFVGLVLLRLYLGWLYIRDRLKSEKIFYEESGWYDGQTWEKPLEMLTRDRLIVSYEVEPILKRLRSTSLILAGLLGTGSLIWFYCK